MYRMKNTHAHNLKHSREPKWKAKEKWWGLKSEEAEEFKRPDIPQERKQRKGNLESPGSEWHLISPKQEKWKSKRAFGAHPVWGHTNIYTFNYLYQLMFSWVQTIYKHSDFKQQSFI